MEVELPGEKKTRKCKKIVETFALPLSAGNGATELKCCPETCSPPTKMQKIQENRSRAAEEMQLHSLRGSPRTLRMVHTAQTGEDLRSNRCNHERAQRHELRICDTVAKADHKIKFPGEVIQKEFGSQALTRKWRPLIGHCLFRPPGRACYLALGAKIGDVAYRKLRHTA